MIIRKRGKWLNDLNHDLAFFFSHVSTFLKVSICVSQQKLEQGTSEKVDELTLHSTPVSHRKAPKNDSYPFMSDTSLKKTTLNIFYYTA